MRGVFIAAALWGVVAASSGCTDPGCMNGEVDTCEVPSPCQPLSFSCEDGFVDLRIIRDRSEVPGGLDSLGAVGDVLLANDQVEVVIEAIGNANYFAPSGGFITDFATRGDDNDSIPHIEHVTGLLPDDAVLYTSMRFFTDEDNVRAVQVIGHLMEDPRQIVATRYEIRSCEPGIRVRTEMLNDSDEDVVWSNQEAFYWGDRATSPFTPGPGTGYTHPPFGLGTVNAVMRNVPWVVGAASVEPGASYALVGCNVDSLEGFHAAQVSLAGTGRAVVARGDYVVFERFLGAAAGTLAQPGVDLALAVREQLYDEAFVTVSGTIDLDEWAVAPRLNRASVYLLEGQPGQPDGLLVPWTHVAVAGDGTFAARVPADKAYVLRVVSFGKTAVEQALSVGTADFDVGTLEVPASGRVILRSTLDGIPHEAQVFFTPADVDTATRTAARWNGHPLANAECAPLLGPTWGGSPACNQVLTFEGYDEVHVPPGRYELFATAGPFATLAHADVTVVAGEVEDVTLSLTSLPDLLPALTLSADFHVHGAKSFDTNMPDLTRVGSFLAQRIDVIAATDHDAIWDYRQAMDELNVGDRVKLLVGLETTGHALFNYNPAVSYPQVVGHYNFWPLRIDLDAPRRGAPYDEYAEPGLLFTRMLGAGLDDDGVIQMNHPWTAGSVGRDFGFPYALGLNLLDPLPLFDDGTAAGVFVRVPPGATFSNVDYHTQEVMNGTDNGSFFAYRAFWFYLLNQGILRAGTANSDSHTLRDNVVGTPRTLVTAGTTKADFSPSIFNRAVREGRMTGTNGPVVSISLADNQGLGRGPSLEPFVPGSGPLTVRVQAAPWVPVDEVRVFVNGALAMRITDGITAPGDPYGTTGLLRLEREIALDDILPRLDEDAWVVVEAGRALPPVADLDCDGVPDTIDNNGDGVVDWTDVDRNDDGRVDDDDLDINGDGTLDDGDTPESCAGGTGPIAVRDLPLRGEPGHPFVAVTPGGYPLAFTNPLILDLDGDPGFSAPGLPEGDN